MAIPKILHYIWLGKNPTPKIFDKCVESWKKYCPDWEIKRWDESNLDIDCCKYCRQAYDAKKFAFASDVLRFQILKEYGGVYVDIDVEFLKPIENLLDNRAFSGFESKLLVNPGVIMGAEPNNKIINEILEDYQGRTFEFNPGNQITVCNIFTDKLKEYGLVCDNTTQELENFKVFSSEFFSPKSLTDGVIRKTKNTMTIHHFEGSWLRKRDKVKSKVLMFVKRLMGEKLVNKLKSKKNQSNTESLNKRMKVLHVLSSNKYSGAENVACQIINALGEDCESAYCSPDGQIAEALNDRNIKFIPLKKMNKTEVKRAIKEFNPNIVHAHDPRAICNVGRINGKFKIIAHVHNNRPDFRKMSVNSLLFNFIAKKKKIRQIFWVSDSCFNDYIFKKKVENKSIVLNNIINQQEILDKAENAEIQDKTDLVFLGRITYQKNPQRLMEIIAKLKEKMPKIKIAVIGDGELLDETKSLAEELKIAENIKFYGFLKNGFGILKNSKLFLMSSRFEGNPMCILEAQTLGLPIIAPQISELKTTVKDGVSGYLYNSDDECVKLIVELLENKKAYKDLKESTTGFSKEYNDVKSYREKILKVYKG